VSFSKRKPQAKPIKTTVKQRIAPLNNILSAVIDYSPNKFIDIFFVDSFLQSVKKLF